MQKLVAVEKDLNNVKQALQAAGYQVIDLDQAQKQEVQCSIITDGDENMLGIQTIMTNTPVINASGMTAQQIIEEVQKYQ